MRLIDADKFLGYLIFSKHIDSLKCKEVKEAVEMCEVNVLEQIRDEIKQTAIDFDEHDDYRRVRGLWIALDIVDQYR